MPKEVSRARAWKANINPNINITNGMAMEMKGAISGAVKRGGTFAPYITGKPVP